MPSLRHSIQVVNNSTYRLDLSGVVGLFGGDNAIDAMETIHLYAGRRWSGWYNYPGSVTVAKRYGQMARGRFWDSLFPGPDQSPAETFNLAGKFGPDYSGVFSGTKLQTKYLGYLIAGTCADYPADPLPLLKRDNTGARETGNPAVVTVVWLLPKQYKRISQSLTKASINVTKQTDETIRVHRKEDPPLALIAVFPSVVSIVACVFSFLGEDRICGSLILIGILCSGISSFVLGTATLLIRVPVPSPSSPPGDGLMFPAGGNIIVLKGEEADVNIVTKGVFELDYSKGVPPRKKYRMIGFSSLLLLGQFITQLLLIPHCTFFGQIMYLASFFASGLFHLLVASYGKEIVHRDLLLRELPVKMDKRKLGTRTQMAVFACLVLGDSDHKTPPIANCEAALTRILPNANETEVWRYWKKKVLKELDHFWKWNSSSSSPSSPYVPTIQVAPEDQTDEEHYSGFDEAERKLLNDLIDDAWGAFNGYPKWRSGRGVEVVQRERHDSAKEFEKTEVYPGSSLA